MKIFFMLLALAPFAHSGEANSYDCLTNELQQEGHNDLQEVKDPDKLTKVYSQAEKSFYDFKPEASLSEYKWKVLQKDDKNYIFRASRCHLGEKNGFTFKIFTGTFKPNDRGIINIDGIH